MKKLRLEMDALRVESFSTDAAAREAGTVHGHSYPNGCFPPPGSDPFLDTCHYATCAGDTCWYSCGGSCDCGGGSAGCPPQESAGYTYCVKDASCVNGCFPPPTG
jgi:hypothetical protein